jgi:RNA polymerase sigma-70 factor (ECF subfamily)
VPRQGICLALVTALLHLPPRQRAVLMVTKGLGWSTAEVGPAQAEAKGTWA